ncbi:MAG: class I SAM-dependent methyltransferase [Dehalococcoidia bacterium]
MASESTDDAALAGQAVYTPLLLAVYDWAVLGVSNGFVWRCPTRRLLALYSHYASARHLEVGAGTGYFLDRCRFPVAAPSITLLDLNPNTLRHAAQRIRRYAPATLRANILEPIPLQPKSFDSIGLNYVLHCVPGSMESKASAFAHLAPLLREGGVLFGSTILADGVNQTPLSRALMAGYNARRIFSNAGDSLTALDRALAGHFRGYHLEVRGCVAIFAAAR